MILLALLGACTQDAKGPATDDTAAADTDPADASDTAETGTDSDSDSDSETDPETDTNRDTDTGPPPPVDADGDGYLSDVDCDDGNFSIYPGAPEFCDGRDSNCDGQPADGGACAGVVDLASVAPEISPLRGVNLTPDLLGGGHGYAALVDWPALLPTGDYGAVFRVIDPVANVTLPYDEGTPILHAWAEGEQVVNVGGLLGVGDMDGDGFQDVGFVNCAGYSGVWVKFGPVPEDGLTTLIDDDESTVFTNGNATCGATWAYGGDFDGDGRTDLVTSDDGTYRNPTSFWVMFGGSTAGARVEVLTSLPNPATYMDRLEDINGDGLADLRVEDDGENFIVSGGDLAGADAAFVEDLAIAWVPTNAGSVVGGWGESLGQLRTAGDWNGDGMADLISVANASRTMGVQTGEAFLLDGTTRGLLTPNEALGSWVGNVDEGYVNLSGVFNADGEFGDELILENSVSGGAVTYTIERHELPALRTPIAGLVLATASTMFWEQDPYDIQGDGYEDWIVYDSDDGSFHLWSGWTIPWDDSTVW